MIDFGNDWNGILADEFKKEYYLKLRAFLKDEYSTRTVFPDMHKIFSALKTTSYHDTKVVIIGQDPYHEVGQAHGMCFSVQPGVPAPPSLMNIYKEMRDDVGTYIPNNGYLMDWAKQGVLLLNTILTVREGEALAHKGKGWEIFTDDVIKKLNEREKPMVFLLWGANARSKKQFITNPNHLVLEAAHPSPLSAYNGFFGCRHFSKCNAFLEAHGIEPVDWRIE